MDPRDRQRALPRQVAALALALLLLAGAPARAAEARWLGTMPAYPGAGRPFGALERTDRIVALTPDPPATVMAFYRERLRREGWTLDENASELGGAPEAPRWMTFSRAGLGKISLAAAPGRHPHTGRQVTVLTVESALKP